MKKIIISTHNPFESFKMIPVLNDFSIIAIIVFFVFGGIDIYAQSGNAIHTITTGSTTLSIRELSHNNYGIVIKLSNTYYEQNEPCAVEVVTGGGQTNWIYGTYSSVEDLGDNTFRCKGMQASGNGSTFTFTDTYSLRSFGCFKVDRQVRVTSAGNGDFGFSTRLTFAENNVSSMSDFDFFAPGIWYKDNAKVADAALASDLNDYYYYWFREDRMPLPIFMLRNKASGDTFSVAHINPDGSTFVGENGLNRIIDGRMKFA
jgi:hypothetical protein